MYEKDIICYYDGGFDNKHLSGGFFCTADMEVVPVNGDNAVETLTNKVPDNEPQKEAESELLFLDVSYEAYYYEAVKWAVEMGIASGTGTAEFSPDSVCSRGQAVTFLHRMIASPEPAAIDMPFIDVKEAAFCYKPVKWAVGSEITGGTSANTFSPDDICTRAQIITFLWRTAGQPKPNVGANPFKDVKEDSFCYDAVLWAVENKITGGTSENTFSPDASCTRAQVVTFLYRFINE